MKDAYDVVIVGAGAAGIAAARRLHEARVDCITLEAADHVGGRARTIEAAGMALDLGCGWLHSADHNPWVAIAERQGLTIDRSEPPWEKQSFNAGMSEADQRDFHTAVGRFFSSADAWQGPDRPLSDFLKPGDRWSPLVDAISTYFNGARAADVSTIDFANLEDTAPNWRVVEGYGAAVAGHGRDLPVELDCAVTRIAWDGANVRIETPKGTLRARAAIVTVSTNVLAQERIVFSPALPDIAEAASHLPLGVVEKVFLRVADADALPIDGHLFGRTDSTDIGSYHLRPFGRPIIEAYFADRLACETDDLHAYAIGELRALLGADFARGLQPLARSHWRTTPSIGGAYSIARPGYAAMRAKLREPIAGKIFFAGEGASEKSFSTAQGAYQTGRAAAEAFLAA